MAAITTEQFQEAQPSSLNLFSLPPTQTAIEKVYFSDVRPISQLSGTLTPIEFIISGQNGLEYVDMKRSKVYVKVKIRHSDGTRLLPTEHVGPVNLLLHSMFSQIDVTMQGKAVTSTTSHYPYKAMIQTLLKYGTQAKTSQLTSQLWIKDTPGHLDNSDVQNGSNTALFERSQLFAGGKSVDMEGPILHDLFSLERYLLNQVGVSVKFYRSKPEFYLVTDESSPDYEIFIEDICLKVCKVQVNPAVIYGQAEVLKHTNAKYPFTRTEIKQISIPTGQISCAFDNLFQGVKPQRVVIAFAKSEAVAGSFTLNGYNFHHFDLSQIGLFVDSIPVTGNVMKLNYDATSGQTTIPAFTQMFEATDKWLCDTGNQLDRHDLAGGYALYCFEIEPSFGGDGNYLTLLKQGNVRLEAQFNKPLPTPTTCIIYAEYPGYFEINSVRDIILE